MRKVEFLPTWDFEAGYGRAGATRWQKGYISGSSMDLQKHPKHVNLRLYV